MCHEHLEEYFENKADKFTQMLLLAFLNRYLFGVTLQRISSSYYCLSELLNALLDFSKYKLLR